MSESLIRTAKRPVVRPVVRPIAAPAAVRLPPRATARDAGFRDAGPTQAGFYVAFAIALGFIVFIAAIALVAAWLVAP